MQPMINDSRKIASFSSWSSVRVLHVGRRAGPSIEICPLVPLEYFGHYSFVAPIWTWQIQIQVTRIVENEDTKVDNWIAQFWIRHGGVCYCQKKKTPQRLKVNDKSCIHQVQRKDLPLCELRNVLIALSQFCWVSWVMREVITKTRKLLKPLREYRLDTNQQKKQKFSEQWTPSV